ncbi:hypothetical protein BHE74_00031235 [Ensete ventricosum]|nr:hypothetical protein GW17_00029081 [Ensete ventricosum]RWW61688.1 hypothetical protein BHE74_00031235 [Ensete ventricosum]RZS11234.1 hypothetical protein BHM03_00042553 [Ensete ventricosum]
MLFGHGCSPYWFYFIDENSALDALQTLADLSVNILLPSSAIESESSAQVKEQTNNETNEKPDMPESLPLNYRRNKSKVPGKKERRHSAGVGSDTLSRRSSEIPKSEFSSESQKSEPQKMEVFAEEGKRSVAKVRRVGQVSPLLRQGKFVKPPENSSSIADSGRTATDLSETTRFAIENQVNLLTEHRSRRKVGLQKALAWKDFKSSDMGDNCPHKYSYAVNRIVEPKESLSHCLSSKLLRRWCMFEWFYSAIDHPWFAKSEFVEYLNHVRLGHIPRLTRVEWGVIRSSLGKPRRLSKQFLKEEREKLEQYRESVRTHYAELQAGLKEGLPTDLARPLSVGQRVIACHPKTRELHDGSVLTVERSRCRVQFDRPELGVKFVMVILLFFKISC